MEAPLSHSTQVAVGATGLNEITYCLAVSSLITMSPVRRGSDGGPMTKPGRSRGKATREMLEGTRSRRSGENSMEVLQTLPEASGNSNKGCPWILKKALSLKMPHDKLFCWELRVWQQSELGAD